jgi:hypothetical protein
MNERGEIRSVITVTTITKGMKLPIGKGLVGPFSFEEILEINGEEAYRMETTNQYYFFNADTPRNALSRLLLEDYGKGRSEVCKDRGKGLGFIRKCIFHRINLQKKQFKVFLYKFLLGVKTTKVNKVVSISRDLNKDTTIGIDGRFYQS